MSHLVCLESGWLTQWRILSSQAEKQHISGQWTCEGTPVTHKDRHIFWVVQKNKLRETSSEIKHLRSTLKIHRLTEILWGNLHLQHTLFQSHLWLQSQLKRKKERSDNYSSNSHCFTKRKTRAFRHWPFQTHLALYHVKMIWMDLYIFVSFYSKDRFWACEHTEQQLRWIKKTKGEEPLSLSSVDVDWTDALELPGPNSHDGSSSSKGPIYRNSHFSEGPLHHISG